MLYIEFLESPVPKEWLPGSEQSILAWITIGDFGESLIVRIDYWKREDYIKHWISAIDKIISSKADTRTALITKMLNPTTLDDIYSLEMWCLYKVEGCVYVQNRFLSKNELTKTFNPKNLEKYVPQRETHTEEGDEISEWTLTVGELKEFHDKLIKHS